MDKKVETQETTVEFHGFDKKGTSVTGKPVVTVTEDKVIEQKVRAHSEGGASVDVGIRHNLSCEGDEKGNLNITLESNVTVSSCSELSEDEAQSQKSQSQKPLKELKGAGVDKKKSKERRHKRVKVLAKEDGQGESSSQDESGASSQDEQTGERRTLRRSQRLERVKQEVEDVDYIQVKAQEP